MDGGNPPKSATSDIIIRLADVNDNKPTFPENRLDADLKENEKPDTVLTTVIATDIDLGENSTIRYQVKSGGADFVIGAKDGVIKSRKSFDREKQTDIKLVVQAYDLGSPRMTSDDVVISVKIIDVNDNVPVWSQTTIRVSVKEHTSVGVQIATVSATDLDKGENARISYSIIPVTGLEKQPVSINENTGSAITDFFIELTFLCINCG